MSEQTGQQKYEIGDMFANGHYATVYNTNVENIVCKRMNLLKMKKTSSYGASLYRKNKKIAQQVNSNIQMYLFGETFLRESCLPKLVNFTGETLVPVHGVETTLQSDLTHATLDLYLQRAEMDLFSYMDKKRLATRSSKGLKISESEICDIIFQLLLQLEQTHAVKIVHRDLKPENILIYAPSERRASYPTGAERRASYPNKVGVDHKENEDEEDHKLYKTVMISDWGISRFLTEPLECYNSQADYTPGKYVCTLPYRAPELHDNNRIYNSKVDIWSVGIIMLDLLMGVNFNKCSPTHYYETDDYFPGIERSFGSSVKSNVAEVVKTKKTRKRKLADTESSLMKRHETDLSRSDWESLVETNYNPIVRSLLFSLLECNPKSRFDAYTALRHPYFSRYHLSSIVASNASIQSTNTTNSTSNQMSCSIDNTQAITSYERSFAAFAKIQRHVLAKDNNLTIRQSDILFFEQLTYSNVVAKLLNTTTLLQLPLDVFFLSLNIFQRFLASQLKTKVLGDSLNIPISLKMKLPNFSQIVENVASQILIDSKQPQNAQQNATHDHASMQQIQDPIKPYPWSEQEDTWLHHTARMCLNVAVAAIGSRPLDGAQLSKKDFFSDVSKYYNLFQHDLCKRLDWNLIRPTSLTFARLLNQIVNIEPRRHISIADRKYVNLFPEEYLLLKSVLFRATDVYFDPLVLGFASMWVSYCETKDQNLDVAKSLTTLMRTYDISEEKCSNAISYLKRIKLFEFPKPSHVWNLFVQSIVKYNK